MLYYYKLISIKAPLIGPAVTKTIWAIIGISAKVEKYS